MNWEYMAFLSGIVVWTDGQMDGWTDGRMDRWIEKQDMTLLGECIAC